MCRRRRRGTTVIYCLPPMSLLDMCSAQDLPGLIVFWPFMLPNCSPLNNKERSQAACPKYLFVQAGSIRFDEGATSSLQLKSMCLSDGSITSEERLAALQSRGSVPSESDETTTRLSSRAPQVVGVTGALSMAAASVAGAEPSGRHCLSNTAN